MAVKVQNLYMQMTDNRMRFTEKVVLRFMNEIKKKKHVFIKPNIVSDELYPTTTHPDVLRYVLKNIPESCKVTVADAPVPNSPVTMGMDSRNVIKKSPLQKVCKQLDYSLENLYDLGFEEVTTPSGMKLMVSKVALECDYMISLPLMKTHCLKYVGLTGALKNNFGILGSRDRIALHANTLPVRAARKFLGKKSEKVMRKIMKDKTDINLAIAELNVIRKPDLFIVDMVDTLIKANEIRHGGKEAHVGVMLAGKDPVALDCLGLELLKKVDPKLSKKKPEDIPAIKYAMELGVGTEKFKRVEIKD